MLNWWLVVGYGGPWLLKLQTSTEWNKWLHIYDILYKYMPSNAQKLKLK